MSLLRFLDAVRKHWWALMSCAAFTFLGVWVLYANENNHWALRATFGLAVFCLFWACFLAWRDKEKEVQQLKAELEAKVRSSRPSPKEEIHALAVSILDFLYKRTQNAPPVPDWQPFFGDAQTMLLESSRASQQRTASMKYEMETVEIYKYKYSRQVAGIVKALPTMDISDTVLGEQGAAPFNSGAIKAIGDHLMQVADLIQEMDKGDTKIIDSL
jgi:hypothetical protein